jgi:threonine dehydratase
MQCHIIGQLQDRNPVIAGESPLAIAVKPVDAASIKEARRRLAGLARLTPLIPLDAAPDDKTVTLKLESLQPIGCFKIRPIGNAVLAKERSSLARGIYTTSSGNSALGVAWMARRLGLAATAVVPENAPPMKLEGLRRLGAHIEMRSMAEWWRAIETGSLEGQAGSYIDAVRDPAAIAGDATIGVEILEQAPAVEAILVPFGGGGLACGIACAMRAFSRGVKIIACELERAAPLTAARAAGAPVSIGYDAGFVSGVGFGRVLPEMWPLAAELIDEVITVTLADVGRAIKLLAQSSHIVAEGAGALPVAAALCGRYAERNVCAVVSGGNLDASLLAAALEDRLPL